MVFVRLPLTFIVALNVNVHLPRDGRLPPLNVKALAPGVPARVPPHVPTLGFTGSARIISGGIVSVKVMPVSGTVPGLINSMLIVELAPPVTIRGSKPLTSSIANPVTLDTFNVEVRVFNGWRFCVLVIFPGGMLLA